MAEVILDKISATAHIDSVVAEEAFLMKTVNVV